MDAFFTQMTIFLQSWGYLGLFLGTGLATSFIPFPSGVLFIFCIKALDPILSVIIATAGNTLGSMVIYAMGWRGKNEWLSKYMHINPVKVQHMSVWVRQHGAPVAILTFLPGFGQAISIALGLMRCHWIKVAFYMIIGKGGRYVLFAFFTYYAFWLVSD